MLISAAIVLLQGFVVSCTKVEFTGDSIDTFEGAETLEQDRMSRVSFNIEWPEGMAEEDKPQFVTVVMNRVQNINIRYTFLLDNAGNILRSATKAEEEGEGGEEPVPETDSLGMVYSGFYAIAAIACADDDCYDIQNLAEFESDHAISMNSLYVTIPEIPAEEKTENKYINFNPIYPYIRPSSPFYFVRPTMTSTSDSKDNDRFVAPGLENHVITLKPMLLTRRIYMSVPIDIEEGVVVDRFTGVISGVPQQAQLMTGFVTDGGLGKLPFEMYPEEGNVYKGYINALGLFSSESENMIVGPGVFTVIIHAHATDDRGKTHNRIFHASLNIKPLIDKAEIMIQTQDRTGYIFSDMENTDKDGYPREIRTYDLIYPYPHEGAPKKLEITRENVFTGGGEGFEIWQVGEDDDNQETNPGLNPEM